MVIKKLNAVLALIAALLLAVHNTLNARMMLLGRVEESPRIFAVLLVNILLLHIIICLVGLILHIRPKARKYTKVRKGWLVQRITGVAVIPLVFFHAFIRAGQFGIGLIPILIAHFFIMVLAYIHIPLSVPNAFVTLGWIDSSKQYRRVQLVCSVICVCLFLLGLIASISEVIAL